MIQRQTSRVYGHSGHPKPIVLSAKVCRLHWFFIMVTGMCFCNVTFISKGMSRWFPSDWYCSCRIIEDTSLITILQSYYKGTNYSFLTYFLTKIHSILSQLCCCFVIRSRWSCVYRNMLQNGNQGVLSIMPSTIWYSWDAGKQCTLYYISFDKIACKLLTTSASTLILIQKVKLLSKLFFNFTFFNFVQSSQVPPPSLSNIHVHT